MLLNHRTQSGTRHNRVIIGQGYTFLESRVEKALEAATPAPPGYYLRGLAQATYAGWQVEGTAFGKGPIQKSAMPSYQGDVGGDTERVVNSHAAAPPRASTR